MLFKIWDDIQFTNTTQHNTTRNTTPSNKKEQKPLNKKEPTDIFFALSQRQSQICNIINSFLAQSLDIQVISLFISTPPFEHVYEFY